MVEVIKIFVTNNPGMTFILLLFTICGMVEVGRTWAANRPH